ncbi:hypothetical protein V2P20_13475 [Methylobacter sp. Wu1]|jgi:hypothetical protein|uniref:hypothetical protein n=1 Tax=Methylobacter sp. Wu1 TaxID=3119359 RepID=UPI002F9438AF
MQYRYQINHDEKGKLRLDQVIHPLSEAQKVMEYDTLPDFLSIRLNPCGIIVTSSVTELNSDSVTVALESDKPESEVFSALTRSLEDLNNQIKSLHLVARPKAL